LKHKEAIHGKLSTLELPQLPQILIQLIDVCRAEKVDIRLVAQTVAHEYCNNKPKLVSWQTLLFSAQDHNSKI